MKRRVRRTPSAAPLLPAVAVVDELPAAAVAEGMGPTGVNAKQQHRGCTDVLHILLLRGLVPCTVFRNKPFGSLLQWLVGRTKLNNIKACILDSEFENCFVPVMLRATDMLVSEAATACTLHSLTKTCHITCCGPDAAAILAAAHASVPCSIAAAAGVVLLLFFPQHVAVT